MTVKEMKERYQGQYADIEVYEFNSKKHSLHTDFVTYSEDYTDDSECNIVFSGLLDKEEYEKTILANCGETFEDFYDSNDKILVLVLEK